MSKSAFRITTGNHFRLTRNPSETATTNAGRKSNPKKATEEGFMPIAANVPIIMLIPPTYGPKRMPNNGARMSDKWNVAPVPIMGTVGIILRAAYNAEKIAMAAIALVFLLRCLRLLISLRRHLNFLHCCVIFYTV